MAQEAKLSTTEMAVELGIDPLTTIVFTNEPSSQKAKQNDGQEDARTLQLIQTMLRSINMLSPKDGRSIVKFKRSPRRIERHVTPEKCRGRELGIILELQTERDVDKLVSAWKKASKKGERRQMIRWPREAAASIGSASEAGMSAPEVSSTEVENSNDD